MNRPPSNFIHHVPGSGKETNPHGGKPHEIHKNIIRGAAALGLLCITATIVLSYLYPSGPPTP